MVAIQAVDQRHLVPCRAQNAGYSQQTEWLDPGVVGGKVDYPGIDAEYVPHRAVYSKRKDVRGQRRKAM
jgi:hypothetical protein